MHIEGTLEPKHMFEMSKKNNIKIPFANIEEVKAAYQFSNLESFLKIYYQGSRVLLKEEDFFKRAEEEILSKEEETEMYEQFQSVIAIVEKISDMVKLINYLEDQSWFKY